MAVHVDIAVITPDDGTPHAAQIVPGAHATFTGNIEVDRQLVDSRVNVPRLAVLLLKSVDSAEARNNAPECWCRCNLDQLNRKVPIQY